MARIGALEHLQMAHRDCLASNRAKQAQVYQALRRESAVLSPRHLLIYRKSMILPAVPDTCPL